MGVFEDKIRANILATGGVRDKAFGMGTGVNPASQFQSGISGAISGSGGLPSLREQRRSDLPSPGEAIGTSIRQQFSPLVLEETGDVGTVFQKTRKLTEGVSDLISAGLGEKTGVYFRPAQSIKEGQPVFDIQQFEDTGEALQSGIQKTLGGTIGTVAQAEFGLADIVFSFAGAAGDNLKEDAGGPLGKALGFALSAVTDVAEGIVQFAAEASDVPGTQIEYEARQDTLMNRWASKVRDALVKSGGLVLGDEGQNLKDVFQSEDKLQALVNAYEQQPTVLEEFDEGDAHYRLFVENLLGEIGEAAGIVAVFKGFEFAGDTLGIAPVKPKGGTVFEVLSAQSDVPEGMDIGNFQLLEQGMKEGNQEMIDYVKENDPATYNSYVKALDQAEPGISKFMEIWNRQQKGEGIDLGDKAYMVNWFESYFADKNVRDPYLQETIQKVKESTMKHEVYNDVMAEVASQLMRHPAFLSLLAPQKVDVDLTTAKSFSDVARAKFKDVELNIEETGGRVIIDPEFEGRINEQAIRDLGDYAESRGLEAEVRANEIAPNLIPDLQALLSREGFEESLTPGVIAVKGIDELAARNRQMAEEVEAERVRAEVEGPRQIEVDKFAKPFGKFRNVIPGLDGMDLPSAIRAAKARMESSPTPTLQEFLDTYARFDEEVGELFGEGADAAEIFSEIKERNTSFRIGDDKPLTPQRLDRMVKTMPLGGKVDTRLAQIAPERIRKLGQDPVVGDLFQPDIDPLTTWDHVVTGMRNSVISKILDDNTGKRLKRQAEQHDANASTVSHLHADLEMELLQDFKPSDRPKGLAQRAWDKLAKNEEAAHLQTKGREIFEAIEEGRLNDLDATSRKTADRIVKRLGELRVELLNHTGNMISKSQEYNAELQAKVSDYRGWLQENVDRVSKEEARVVRETVDQWEAIIEAREDKIQRDYEVLERIKDENPNYLPHIIDPVMRNFAREHMPDAYAEIEADMSSMSNRFLKERVGFPFFMKNAVEAFVIYEKRAIEQLTLDEIVLDAYQESALKGYVPGTPKGDYMAKYAEEKLKGKMAGREAVVPTLEPIYDAIYKSAKDFDQKVDMEILSKLVEETRLIDQVQYDYLKENATDFDSLDIEPVGDGKYGLTIQTLKPDSGSYDRALMYAKMQMYSGTIGMSPRTTAMNIVSQPLMAAAHSGLPMMEAVGVVAKETANAIKALKDPEFRDAMLDTGMTPTTRQVLNPEGGVGREASTVYGKFIEFSLANMKYTEMIARYVVGRLGYIGYEKGLLPKDRVGEIVEVGGKQLSKDYSNEFNFEYTQDMAPAWVDSTVGGIPVGRAIYTLSSFGQKNLELHGKLVKNADFIGWLRDSKDVLDDPTMGGPEKVTAILNLYKGNANRIGLAKEAAFGLAAAMVMGQVFDLDWDEFLWGGIGFGISNPITNLFMGAGSFTEGIGGKLKPFVPFRGAVRGLDKTLGTDLLSNYRDYGNVPQLKELIFNQE